MPPKNDDGPKKGGGRKRKNNGDDDTPPKSKKKTQSQPPQDDPVHIFFPLPQPNIFSQMFNEGGDDKKDDIPSKYKALKEKIQKSNLDDKIKERVIARLKNVDSDKHKHIEWIETVLKIPFKIYSHIPVSKTDHPDKISKYFDDVYSTLDNATYGMQQVKEEIVNYVAQIVSTENKNMPRIIALHSEPGCGKTALIRRGLSQSLNRPFKGFSGGGLKDVSFFTGFSFTYSGSRPGAIVNGLIECGVMNPIFFIDEIDKISNTNDGIEVQNILIHLTDPVQNNNFEDKYFDGIPIDISKVIFIFAFNDINLINPILKDRLHIIKIDTPTKDEKVVIGTKYLTKELYPNIGFNEGDIIFSEEIMRYIINQHCEQGGIRPLKKCIETILLKINTARFIGQKQKYKSLKNKLTLPIEISRDMVDELVDKIKNDKDEYFRSLFI